MIAVDSSAWIDHLNDRRSPEVMRLRAIVEGEVEFVAIGDLILCEVLQGFSSDREAAFVQAAFRNSEWVSMTSRNLAIKAASNCRAVRSRGITVRKTIDLLIGISTRWLHILVLRSSGRDEFCRVRFTRTSRVGRPPAASAAPARGGSRGPR